MANIKKDKRRTKIKTDRERGGGGGGGREGERERESWLGSKRTSDLARGIERQLEIEE